MMKTRKLYLVVTLILLLIFSVYAYFSVFDYLTKNRDNLNDIVVGSCVVGQNTRGHIMGYDYGIVYNINDDVKNDGFCMALWKIKGNTQQPDWFGGDACNSLQVIPC